MPRIVPSLILVAAFGAAPLPATAASDGATLDGQWMAIGDLLGLLPGHIESLLIEGGRAASVLWRQDCAADCPLPLAEGALAATSFDLTLTADAPVPAPFDGEAGALWPLYALDGGAWQTYWQGDRLMSVREATINGASVPLMRIWLRVAPEVPEQLFDFLMAHDLDIARALCPVTGLRAEPDAWAAFAAHLALTAPGPLAMRLGGDYAPAPGEAAALALTRGWQDGSQPLPPGMALLPGLPWPAGPAMVAAAQDCDARLFGG